MKMIESVRSVLLTRLNFETVSEEALHANVTVQNLLNVGFTDIEEKIDNKGNTYRIGVLVRLKAKEIEKENDEDIVDVDSVQRSFENDETDLFRMEFEYNLVFTIKDSDANVYQDEIGNDIRLDVTEFIQSYARRDAQYVSLDSAFDASAFPLQFVSY